MLHLEEIEPHECELCARRREQEPECELCHDCAIRFEDYKLLKQEILGLREHERAVSVAAGLHYELKGCSAAGPRDVVLQAIKEHRRAWDQAQAIKRLLQSTGESSEKPFDGKTPAERLEQSLGRIKEIEEKILAKLTPKEQEVLKKRFPKEQNPFDHFKDTFSKFGCKPKP